MRMVISLVLLGFTLLGFSCKLEPFNTLVDCGGWRWVTFYNNSNQAVEIMTPTHRVTVLPNQGAMTEQLTDTITIELIPASFRTYVVPECGDTIINLY